MNKQGKVSNFLSSYHSKNTRLAYEQALGQFLKNLYGESSDLDASAERYFTEKRDCEKDIEEFVDSIRGLAPKSVKLKIAIVKTFLMENDVELSS